MAPTENQDKIKALRDELFKMQSVQKKIDDELMMNRIILEQNNVGMKDELTDKEDFPRNDIDIVSVRKARHDINRLENDAKDLLDRMKEKLEELHALSK